MSKGMLMVAGGIGGMLVCVVLAFIIIKSWEKFRQEGKTLTYAEVAPALAEQDTASSSPTLSKKLEIKQTELLDDEPNQKVSETEYL